MNDLEWPWMAISCQTRISCQLFYFFGELLLSPPFLYSPMPLPSFPSPFPFPSGPLPYKTPLTSFQLWSVGSVDLLDVPASRDMPHRPNCTVPIFATEHFCRVETCLYQVPLLFFSSGLSGSVGLYFRRKTSNLASFTDDNQIMLPDNRENTDIFLQGCRHHER